MRKRILWTVSLLLCLLLAGCTDVAQPESPSTLPNDISKSTDITETISPAETEIKPVHTHAFAAATCTSPKTCQCGETEGTALGHGWKDATCTAPKTCDKCGIVDGAALGHTWKAATCLTAKTCSVCSKTEGSAAAHQYNNGKCVTCSKADPNYVSQPKEAMVWIPTNGGQRYHSKSTCSQMKNPEKVTKSEAIELGFTPCGRCY